LLERLCFEHLRSRTGSMVLLSGLLLEIVFEILRGQGAVESVKSVHWMKMQEAMAEIQRRAESPLSVAALARELGLSASHFRKLFRQVHGQSPRAFHRQARIQKGRELLTYTNLTVSEIAFRLGFSTVHNFSRAFRQIMGVPPKRYREGAAAKM